MSVLSNSTDVYWKTESAPTALDFDVHFTQHVGGVNVTYNPMWNDAAVQQHVVGFHYQGTDNFDVVWTCESSGLSTGAIVGIAIGASVVGLLVVSAVYFRFARKAGYDAVS